MNGFKIVLHRLAKNHKWTARPGCAAFVVNRGAVRFDVPRRWLFEPCDDKAVFRDKKHPHETVRLQLYALQVPLYTPFVYPIQDVLEKMLAMPEDCLVSVGAVTITTRSSYRMAWGQMRYLERSGKPLNSRITLIIGPTVQAMLTLDFYDESATAALAAWETMIDTLEIGKHMPDPSTGVLVDPLAG